MLKIGNGAWGKSVEEIAGAVIRMANLARFGHALVCQAAWALLAQALVRLSTDAGEMIAMGFLNDDQFREGPDPSDINAKGASTPIAGDTGQNTKVHTAQPTAHGKAG
ncbi:hypothetical protein PG996_004023 [Apiospora saccharicola]|uniref:Uncharacterized protein n=1 Tax=Apiospora saccharicola TaxID=335842 RepID=A0ABR1W6Q7_9PEZI